MIYPIVLYGDPVLKRRSEDVNPEEVDVVALANDMFETMEAANGVGLAAPQIGKALRIFVVDSTPMEESGEEAFRGAFINPTMIEEHGDEWNFEEGCLSIPGIREDVSRNPGIRIKYFDEEMKEHEREFTGVVARIIQHEYDHIEGVLFTDHLSPFKKRLLKSKLAGISKGKVDVDYRVKIPVKR